MDELKHIKNIESGTVNSVNYIDTGISTGTACFDPWSEPYLIDTIVDKGCIELIYRQDSTITYVINIEPYIKIFKVIYSCKNGKWHESKRIEGSYISARDETYEF